MGVPVFFSWLSSRFDKQILYKEARKLDRLYVDFNAGIHPAVKNDPSTTIPEMYDKIIAYLDCIVNFVKPQELLFIAIDGVAPKAKMEQQRSRRYKSVLDKAEQPTAEKKKEKSEKATAEKIIPDIDFNMISPGTVFMETVRERINVHIQNQTAIGGMWHGLKVIFSDASYAGEGEHKIMDHIRSNPTQSLAIYGLDSDLLFLSLLNNKNIVLVREVQEFAPRTTPPSKGGEKKKIPEFTYLLIERLYECLVDILKPSTSLKGLENFKIYNKLKFVAPECLSPKHVDANQLIADFTFLSFMLGNDFLPHLPSLSIRDNGLESIIMAYKIAYWQTGTCLVKKKGEKEIEINQKMFLKVLEQLDTVEIPALELSQRNREMRISRFRQQGGKDDYIEHTYNDIIRFGEHGWETRYYQVHFNMHYRHPTEFLQHKQMIVSKFLEGMKWTYLYYTGNNHNWDWHYCYSVAPTVHDLFQGVKGGIDINQFTFPATEPVMPFVQLMSILPPASAHLLPQVLAVLMTDRTSSIHYYYPIKVSLSLHGCRYRWECHVKLPPIDCDELTKIVKARSKYISPIDLLRGFAPTPTNIRMC